jgi:hypothetical protein
MPIKSSKMPPHKKEFICRNKKYVTRIAQDDINIYVKTFYIDSDGNEQRFGSKGNEPDTIAKVEIALKLDKKIGKWSYYDYLFTEAEKEVINQSFN